jgi:CubicO group peptidase (beta-lactamase class C family)
MRPLRTGGGDLVDATTLAAHGRGLDGDARRRHPAYPDALRLGFMKSMDNRRRSLAAKLWGEDCDSVILGTAAFGHVGAGGSLGFADPVAGMSFGYTMNRMGPGLLMNERGQSLVDAAYLSLGYRNKDGGVWVK